MSLNIQTISIEPDLLQFGEFIVSTINYVYPLAIDSLELFGVPDINLRKLVLNSIPSGEKFDITTVIKRPRQIQSVARLVRGQVPEYARNEFPRFVEFLQKYYEWMENRGNALDLMKNLIKHQDVDRAEDPFLQGIQSEVMRKFPKNLYVDPSNPNNKINVQNVIKNIVQFYGRKGTEQSFKFLFLSVLGTEVDFYYPREDILKPSDGKWIQNYSIRTILGPNSSDTPFAFANKRIVGATSNTTALVEYVIKFNIGFETVYEIFLNKSSIAGQFLPGEVITSDEAPGVRAVPSPVAIGFSFYNRGSGYSKGAKIKSNFNLFGVQEIEGVVAEVNTQGNVLSVDLVSPGFNIPNTAFDDVNPNDRTYSGILSYDTDGNDSLHVIPQIGTIIKYPGYYLNDDGKLSDSKFIQDGYFYQQFSYVLRSSESLDNYKTLVQDIIHPIGLKMFGEFLTENFVKSFSDVSSKLYLDWYAVAPYDMPISQKPTWELTIHLDDNIQPELDEYQLESLVSYATGANIYSIDKFKFTYKPNNVGNDQNRMTGLNLNYWNGEHANYQIKDFFDLSVSDFLYQPWTRTKIQPEPIVKTTETSDTPTPLPPG